MIVITVARKPFPKTLVSNIQKNGTGCINIDACRITPTGEWLGGGDERPETIDKKQSHWSQPWMHRSEDAKRHAEMMKEDIKRHSLMGRFPANIILEHNPDCVSLGLAKIKGFPQVNVDKLPVEERIQSGEQHGHIWGRGVGIGVKGVSYTVGFGDESGQESVESWECVGDCPVRQIDVQSGNSLSSGGRTANISTTSKIYGGGKGLGQDLLADDVKGDPGYGDLGGASRYFKQIKQESKLEKGINVLSLFDGMSCGQIALNRLGIKYDKYFASEIDKHSMAVTMHNYPDTIQLGDVTQVFAKDLPQIDLLIGGSPCFVAGTKIICEKGIRSIEDICVGNKVLTHKGRYKKIIRIGNDSKPLCTLLSQGATETTTTANHPYYVRTRKKLWNNNKRTYEWVFSDPEWVEVCDIKIGDYIGTPILRTEKNPLNLSSDECYLLGLYIGDGHTRKDYRTSENRPNDRHWQLIISVGKHEKVSFKKNIKLKHSFYEHTKSVYRAVFSSKHLVKIAEKHCGVGAKNKYLSKMLLDLPKPLLEKVLEGYLFADGSCRRETYRTTTISKSLVETLALAVAKVYRTTCSIEYTVRPAKTIIEGRVVNQQNTYTITYRKYHTKQSRAWVIEDVVWNPVKKIKNIGVVDTVYNLEVGKDNSYVANNHIVHNCQGFSFAGKQLNFKDPRSMLFFEFVRLLRECKPKYFLLENVKMKREYEYAITELLGVSCARINSNLVSAQNRSRLYWTNIPGEGDYVIGSFIDQPEDKGILLQDILEDNQLKEPVVLRPARSEEGKRIRKEHQATHGTDYTPFQAKVQLPRTDGKANCLTTSLLDNKIIDKALWRKTEEFPYKADTPSSPEGKAKCLRAEAGGKTRGIGVFNEDKTQYRLLTPEECEALQTVPRGYTSPASRSQRCRMLGNGWTIDVITHIMKGMEL